MSKIKLPHLDALKPTLESTLYKAIEEAGELARAVSHFLQIEESAKIKDIFLDDVLSELLDLAQTCVTMIFVLEEDYKMDIDILLKEHLQKLEEKKYVYKKSGEYSLFFDGKFRTLCLPRLEIENVTLLTTVCKIQEELGELTQFLGKHAGASGEKISFNKKEIKKGSALELLDVAQCCFTLIYILEEKYAVDIEKAVAVHVQKLRKKGYMK